MLDIVEIKNGDDMVMVDTVVMKAANVCSVQLGNLTYSPDFGVDLRFFITSQLQFQNESFKSYIVQRLIESRVSVSDIITTVDRLFQTTSFTVGDVTPINGGLIL